MPLYVYRAYEDKFCGLNDMDCISIVEADNLDDANEYAREASFRLIQDSDIIYNSLYSEAEDKYEQIFGVRFNDEPEMQENFANILQKIIEADVLYEVYELNDDMTFSYSIEEMLEIAKEDFEEFVVDFGEPIFI
jgi:hypothetical protein